MSGNFEKLTVALAVKKTTGQYSVGTGVPVARGVVLTARHVVVPDLVADTPVRVRFWHATEREYRPDPARDHSGYLDAICHPDQGPEAARGVIWSSAELDAALVAVSHPASVPVALLSGLEPFNNAEWLSEGFPHGAWEERTPTPRRLSGKSHSRLPNTARYQVDAEIGMNAGQPDQAAQDGWSGASGASLFVNGRVMGILLARLPNGEARVLEAVSVLDMLKDAGFRQALGLAELPLGKGRPTGASGIAENNVDEAIAKALADQHWEHGELGSFAGHAFVTRRDFERDESGPLPKMASVGRRPTLALLRDEQYLQRTQQISALGKTLNDATETNSWDEYSDLPIFWISGASGSGKSVLLLQYMKKLVQEGRRVLWIEDDAASLQPILEAVLSSHRGTADPLPDYIFIDDLYAPRNQQLVHIDKLQRTVSANSKLQWPTVVTCGPSQYYEEFRAEVAGDSIVAKKWVLPKVSSDEVSKIERFFSQRSGHVVALRDRPGDENGLFISVAVELRHGNLEAFAKRFADRIVSLDLLAPIRRIIALNRLYISAPRIWLAEHELDRLASFNEDSEFLLEDLAGDRRYIRLTHPHISDWIYRALCVPANPRVYASDIVQTFDWAVKTDIPTAILIAKALRSHNERLDQVDMQRVVDGLSQALSLDTLEAKEWDPHQKAELLTALATWNAKREDLNLADGFGWDLRKHASDAVAALGADAALLWFYLVSSVDLDAQDFNRVIAYLESNSGLEDPGWHLLFGALQAGSANAAKLLQQRIICLGLARLESSPRFSGSGTVLLHVINWNKTAGQPRISERVKEAIRTWLKENPFHHRLPKVVQARFSVAEHREIEDLITASLKWLGNNAVHPKVWGPYFTWFTRKLIKKKDPRIGELLDNVVKLLDQPKNKLAGTYVVEVARDNLPHFGTDPTPALRRFALNSLEEIDYQGWSFFLEYLESLKDLATDEKQTVVDFGKKWLNAHEDSSEMSFVWNTLFSLSEELDRADRRFLVDFGKRLLSSDAFLPSFIPVAANLVNFGLTLTDVEQHDEVLELCTETLLRAPLTPATAFLTKSLLLRDTDSNRLDRVAGFLAETCRLHLDAIRNPESEIDRTKISIDFHLCAQRFHKLDSKGYPPSATRIHALDRYFEEAIAKTQEEYPVGSQARCVLAYKANRNCFLLLPTGCIGLLSAASIPYDRLAEFDEADICDAFDLYVSMFDEGRGILLSAYSPEQDALRRAKAEVAFAALSVGQKLCCEVVGSANYGIFVMTEEGVSGLLHKSKMNGRSIVDFEIGQEVELWIHAISVETTKIGLTALDPSVALEKAREAENFFNSLSIGQLLQGTVVNVVAYGVFFELCDGLTSLLHASKLGEAKLADFEIGAIHYVRVAELDPKKSRVALTLPDAS